jgi:REP element-mobilizing transposase RayT
MANINNQVYLHFVWGTYDRHDWLTPEVWVVVRQCIDAVGKRFHCPIIAVGGVEDHIHVLLRFASTISMADLAQEMKGYSSHTVSERFPGQYFAWQGGYGVFPIAPRFLNRVEAYINNQLAHHRDATLLPDLENTGFTPKQVANRRDVAPAGADAGRLESS